MPSCCPLQKDFVKFCGQMEGTLRYKCIFMCVCQCLCVCVCDVCDPFCSPCFPRIDAILSPHVCVEATKEGSGPRTDSFVIPCLCPHLRAGVQLTWGKETSRLKVISHDCKGWERGISGGGKEPVGGLSPLLQLPGCPSCLRPRPRPINGSMSLPGGCCLFRLKVAVPPLASCGWGWMGQGRVATAQTIHPLPAFPRCPQSWPSQRQDCSGF